MTTFKEQIEIYRIGVEKYGMKPSNQILFNIARKFDLSLQDAQDALNGTASDEVLNTEFHPIPPDAKMSREKAGYRFYVH